MADMMIDCSMCKEETKHMELDWFPVRDPRRFKCYNCGEYNMQKTIADGIMEPLKHVWESLRRLESESQDIPVAQARVGMIVSELEGAMAVVRRSVESLLEATMGPEDDEDAPVPGGNDYRVVEVNTGHMIRYGGDHGLSKIEEDDFSDMLYMTARREDGKEK